MSQVVVEVVFISKLENILYEVNKYLKYLLNKKRCSLAAKPLWNDVEFAVRRDDEVFYSTLLYYIHASVHVIL